MTTGRWFEDHPPLAAGDVGFVIVRRRDPQPATVVKVGRRWATLDRPEWMGNRAEMTSGFIDGTDGAVFYTPERFEAYQRLVMARDTMKAHSLRFEMSGRWHDRDVVALAEWLDANHDYGRSRT